MKRLKDFLLWALFTEKCKYCGELVEYGNKLCKDCEEKLPRIEETRCRFCGAGKQRCQCDKHQMRFDEITAPFYYEGGIITGLHNFKFGEKSFMAEVFAEDMANSIKKDFSKITFDFIAFVPFSKLQKQQRSYNQSELLAEELGKRLGIPVENILIKLFDTGVQHKTTQHRRKGNVFGVFDVNEKVNIIGKTILLVDDIKTTGATFNECAKMLKIRGAERVCCVSVAMTGKPLDVKTQII